MNEGQSETALWKVLEPELTNLENTTNKIVSSKEEYEASL